MSTLVIQLPEHRRLRAGATGEESLESSRRREYLYATSGDGIELDAQGEAAAIVATSKSVLPKLPRPFRA